MNQFPPSPKVSHQDRFKFFKVHHGINDTDGKLLPVSMTNFATSFASVVDIGGKFATCINDTNGK
jgi:hypothetical protein